MKKYKVYLHYEVYGVALVEAESPEEAAEIVELGDVEDIVEEGGEFYVVDNVEEVEK